MGTIGLPDTIPNKYTGPEVNLVPIRFFPHRPVTANKKFPVGQMVILSKNPTTGAEGELWYLSKFTSGNPIWLPLTSGGSGPTITLSDTANTLVYPTAGGNIQLEGTAGQIDITSVPGSNKLVFSLPGGGGPIDSFAVQAVTAPGVTPVVPTAGGLVTINGAVVANHSVPLETRSRAVNAFNLEVQYATTAAATDGTKSGVCHFDSARFTADAAGFIGLNGSGVGQTLTAQSGGALNPTAGNWNIYGLGEMTTSGATSTISILQPRAAKFIVDPTLNYGTHQTITAATAAASAGDIILIRQGTYDEDFVPKACTYVGMNNSNGGQVVIKGKVYDNGVAVSVKFNGITFLTDSDFSFQNTAASTFIAERCYFRGSNNTPLSVGGSGTFKFFDSNFDLETTGIGLYNTTGGTIFFERCVFGNSGNSTTVGTHSAGTVVCRYCVSEVQLATTSTAAVIIQNCQFGGIQTPYLDKTWLTTAGSGTSHVLQSILYSGTASTMSIGAGTTVYCANCTINSSNANVLTGGGTLYHGNIVFTGSSTTTNVTTETALTVF